MPAEPVDGLLRIADDEELAGNRRHVLPTLSPRIVGRQQQQDLGLNGIGVLELVDENPRELRLEMRAAPPGRSLEQVARARQQIGEVERTGRVLELLIARGRLSQLLLQAGREVGVGRAPELLQIREEVRHAPPAPSARVTPVPHL